MKYVAYVECPVCSNRHEMLDWAKGSLGRTVRYKCEKCERFVAAEVAQTVFSEINDNFGCC